MKNFKKISAMLMASVITAGTISSLSAGAFYSGYDSGYDGLYSLLKDAFAVSRNDDGNNLFADGSACNWDYGNDTSKYHDTTFILADKTQHFERIQVSPVYPNEISILPADKTSYDTICNIMKENFPEIYVETYAEDNGNSDYLTLTGCNGRGKIPFEEAIKTNITLSKSREIYDAIIKNSEISKFDFRTQNVSTISHFGSITYYHNVDDETKELLTNYVSENIPNCHIEEQFLDNESWSASIPNELNITVVPNEDISPEEHYAIANQIYKGTGIVPYTDFYESASEIKGDVIDMHNNIDGDANNDGELSLADAISIMQAIGNPDEYTLTPQGEFNADIAGNYDGITNMDALAVQKRLLNLE